MFSLCWSTYTNSSITLMLIFSTHINSNETDLIIFTFLIIIQVFLFPCLPWTFNSFDMIHCNALQNTTTTFLLSGPGPLIPIQTQIKDDCKEFSSLYYYHCIQLCWHHQCSLFIFPLFIFMLSTSNNIPRYDEFHMYITDAPYTTPVPLHS